MKSTTLFGLFFLLCTFISCLPSATSDHVFDTDGEIVRNGGTYYILPAIKGKGGGIEKAATGKETRPLTVVQSANDDSKGLLITISSPARIIQIYQGLALDIRFTSQPRSASWTIVEDLPEGPAVKLTGYKGTVVAGRFKIQKASHYSNAYKLVFCRIDGRTCGDIGIHVDDDGNRRLVLTHENNPLLLRFQKLDHHLKNHVSETQV